MQTYVIYFDDGSNYVGATTKPLHKRMIDHRSCAKNNYKKYINNKLYIKMRASNQKFRYKTLALHSTEDKMFDHEKAMIKLFNGELNLNLSSGGKYSAKGIKKVGKKRTSFYFKIYCRKTKKLLYFGNSQKEAHEKLGIPYSTISHGLKSFKLKKNSGRSSSVYRFMITGGYTCP